jgi:hypothetical protein
MKWDIKWWESFEKLAFDGRKTHYGGLIALFYMIPGMFFVLAWDQFKNFSLRERITLFAICLPWILLLLGGVAHCLWRGSFLKMPLPIFLLCAVLPVIAVPVVVAIADRYDFTDFARRNSTQIKATPRAAPERLKAESEHNFAKLCVRERRPTCWGVFAPGGVRG